MTTICPCKKYEHTTVQIQVNRHIKHIVTDGDQNRTKNKRWKVEGINERTEETINTEKADRKRHELNNEIPTPVHILCTEK
jgi:hypothetical protein